MRLSGACVCMCTARRFIFVKCLLPEQIGAQVSTEFIFEKEKQTPKKLIVLVFSLNSGRAGCRVFSF